MSKLLVLDKPVLLLDLDDTTVEQVAPWVNRYFEKTGIMIEREKWVRWDMNEFLSKEEEAAMLAILEEPGFFRYLPPFVGAIYGIRHLTDYFHIIFLTKGSKFNYRDKHEWVDEHFAPLLTGENNLILTGRKDRVIGDYLVDDAPKNLFNSPCKHKIVFDAPWNRHVTEFPRVHNWRELVALLLQMEGITLPEKAA